MALPRKLAAGAAGVALAVPLIAQWEGLRLTAYRDVVGIPTICYGETLGVQMGQAATKAECDATLALRVAQFATEIDKCLPPSLPEQTAAAFVSVAYNIGSPAFCKSSMSRLALRGDLRGACNALLLWDKGRINGVLQRIRGLTNRRQDEHRLCLSGLEGPK